MGLASALGGFKDAKSAKDAKDANPWKLAPLALLGRAGDPIVAEAGGYTTGCGKRSPPLPASRRSSTSVRGSKPLPFAVSDPVLFFICANLRHLWIHAFAAKLCETC